MSDPHQLGFRALADPTRRQILHLLAEQDLSIADVAQNFQMTRAAVKKHLSILQDGNLITMRPAGRTTLNALHPDGLKQVADWFGFFDHFWQDRLTTLKSEIEKDMQ